MAFQPGDRLGPYEIVSAIGAGGMGEVYRASDARLGRHVAIKVLPAEVSSRPDALARFEREARAVAALSHPNILAIHDVGSDGGRSYAVTELLDGETLRDALAAGPLPMRRAVDYAVQLARGLAAAHDKGIVHRDLKPENIFVTTDERVKILDFGLARQEDSPPIGSASLAPTLNNPTEPGTLLGTVGYMAPEQVRGAVVDWRADLFSFGAVLYEMVTGQRAFRRDTAAETMTAILREEVPEPPPGRSIAPPVDRIIRHCLEKKPEARFRSAHDLAFALDNVANSAPSSSSGLAAPALHRAPWRLAAGIVALVASAAWSGGWLVRRLDRSAASTAALQAPQFRQLTFNRGVIQGARFAPDGRTVVYSALWDGADPRVFLTRLESPGATLLPAPSAILFGVSPDAELALGVNPAGRMAGEAPLEGTLVRAPLLGGAAQPVLEHVTFADWSPVGAALAVARLVGSRQRLEYPVGKVLFETDGEIGHPRVSPDGSRVAFLDWPVKADDRGSVAIVDRRGVKQTISRTWEAVRGVAWRPDGGEVWYTAASAGTTYDIWGSVARPSDERRIFSGPGGVLLQDVTKDGKALVTRYDRAIHVEGSIDGSDVRSFSWLEFSFARDISPDGQRIAFTYSGQGSSPSYDVYVRSVRDADAARIGEGQAQQFSPDGESVLAVVHGPPARLLILPIRPGEPKTVATGSVTVTQARWLPDGRQLLVIGTEPGKGARAYVTAVAGGTLRAITPEGVTSNADQIALSPDGTRVALGSPEGGLAIYSTGEGRRRRFEDSPPMRRLLAGRATVTRCCSSKGGRRGELSVWIR